MKRRLLCLLLALALVLGLLPGTALAAEPVTPTVTVSFTSQAGGAFLHAPQLNAEVSGGLAESYGFTDSVTGGVSALDVLVKAHEVMFGKDFTKEAASSYLAVSESGFVSTLFGEPTSANGFILNGMYPHDGTESPYGGYNGTTVTTQAVQTGDQVDFFIYQDDYWSDMLTWFCKNGVAADTLTVTPGQQVALNLRGYSYMGCYTFLDKEELHNSARATEIGAAQLAWVDVATGALTNISGAVTSEDTEAEGDVTVTMPTELGTYYLTAYMPESEITENYASPLVMTLTPVTVSNEVSPEPAFGPCDLTALSVMDFTGFPDTPLTLKPAFDSNVTAYTVDPVDYQQYAKMAYVKATAASDDATISATIGATTKEIISGDTNWQNFNNLVAGADNTLTLTVTNGSDTKTYTVTIPMAADPTPNITTQPQSMEVTQGSAAVLTLAASAPEGASLTYQWYTKSGSDKTAIENATEDTYNAPTDTVGETTYFCEVTNTVGGKTYKAVSDDATITVSSDGKKAVEIELSETSPDAANYTAKLYASADSEKATDLLAGVTPTAFFGNTYNTRLAPGTYTLEVSKGTDKIGAIELVVTEAETQENKLFVVPQIYANNQDDNGDRWVWGTDYTVSLSVTSQEGADRKATLGWAPGYENSRGTCLCYAGDTVQATFTPNAELHPDYLSITAKGIYTARAGSLIAVIPAALECTFTVPAATQARVGTLSTYYVYTTLEPTKAEELGDTVRYTYTLAKDTAYYCRVTGGEGNVTYWDWVTPTEDTAYTITQEQLRPAAAAQGAKTVLRDFSQSSLDVGSMLMTVNPQGYLNLAQGETYTLNCFRSWQTVEGSSGSTEVGEPDYHYTVIDPTGASSNVVTVTPDANNSGAATITANSAGTAIVLVTYDALYNNNSGNKGWSGFFSASWPENTGVFVVSVGADGTGIQTNMNLNEGKNTATDSAGNMHKVAGDAIDSELDVLYYFGDEGASYSFTPESGVTVEVLRPTLTENGLTYSGGFTSTGVTQENGTYTVTGLTQGKNIVKVSKNGVAAYQVLTVKALSYELYQDKALTKPMGDMPLTPGQEAYLLFDRVYIPANKMAGIYNMAGTIVLTDGTNEWKGGRSQYDFASRTACQTVKLTAPATGNVLTLWGNIYENGYGDPYGNHRFTSYEKGRNANFTAKQIPGYMGDIPKLSFPVTTLESIKVTTQPTRTVYHIGDSFDPAGMVVKAVYGNGTELEITDYTFTTDAFASNGSATVTVSYTQGSTTKTTEVTVTVAAAALDRIAITTPPTKAAYIALDAFDPAGMVVTAYYADKTTAEITQYTVTPEKLITTTTEVTITYNGKTATTPVTVTGRVLSSLKVTHPANKTQYTVGDIFDPTGIEITATYNDGTTQVVTDKVTYLQTVFEEVGNYIYVAAEYTEGEVTRYAQQQVKVVAAAAPGPDDPTPTTITVKFTLLGDEHHDSDTDGQVHTLKDGNLTEWIAQTDVTVNEDATVSAVLARALGIAGIPYENPTGNYVTTVRGLGEFSNGPNSGWMYTLNGAYPDLGVSEQTVKNGDVIVFHYTDDFTAEKSEAGGDKPQPGEDVTDEQMEAAYVATGNELASRDISTGSINGEWLALGLARANHEMTDRFQQSYLDAAKAFIHANYQNGKLDQNKSTENARLILALTAMGQDPASFVEGKNLLAGLADFDWVKNQGINGPIWTLIALDSQDYEIPNSSYPDKTKRDRLVEYILNSQLSTGGWSTGGGSTADADMTAMAIQALAPYANSNADVKNALDKAVALLSKMQDDATGAFKNADGDLNAESTAQVVVALATMGIDPNTDLSFTTTGGLSVMDGLMQFYTGNGTFKHTADGEADDMATEQSYYAMVAYYRMKNGQTALYDMSDLLRQFNITVDCGQHGKVTAPAKAAAGTEITITVKPDTGYELDTLKIDGKAQTVDKNNQIKYTMPEHDITIQATFQKADNIVEQVAELMESLSITPSTIDQEEYEAMTAVQKAYDSLTPAQKDQLKSEFPTAFARYERELKDYETGLENTLKKYQQKLDKAFKKYDEKDYSEENWEKLEKLYDDARDALEEDFYREAMEETLDTFLEEADEIATGGDLEVTFRLIGDFKHEDAEDHVKYVTWVPTTEYSLEAGSTVYDLFVEAMDDAGLSHKGASSNYVSSIQAPRCLGGYWLGEFDNGRNSGWMYTVNGDHPSYGLREWELEDGDEVVWHYIDDYKKEENKNTWLEARDMDPEDYVDEALEQILIIGKHGDVEPDEIRASDLGKDITFKFIPDKGYTVKDVKIDGKSKGRITSYKYEDLRIDSRIEVEFTDSSDADFTDVRESDWFYDDVQFAVQSGLFNGSSATTFSPNASMTRAMLVTVLYRLEGEPDVTGSSPFHDVSRGQWYSDAVNWAQRNDIVNGVSDTAFAPNANITREQMAAILFRYAEYKDYSDTASNRLTGYADFDQISAYALKPLKWANAEGLINGRTTSTLAPKGTATRAEVAAILHRFVENVVD